MHTPIKTRRGASLTGYGLVVGLISVVALGAISGAGSSVQDLFGETSDTLGAVANEANQALPDPSASASASASPEPSLAPGTSYVFTTCGQTGPTVPTQGNCDSAYSSTSLDGLVTVSSGLQSFTIPATGTWQVALNGAQGSNYSSAVISGSGTTQSGGQGGYTVGRRTLNAGDVVTFGIGQQGLPSDDDVAIPDIGGFNGGGSQNNANENTGGGGGTDFRLNGTSLNDRILVAGGGGGAVTEADGGYGGGTIGQSGTSNKCSISGGQPTGGTQSAGGAAGTYSIGDPTGVAGSFGQGGDASNAGGWNTGGGGGGGWYGGGGGGNCVSGAGGSSYTDGSFTNLTMTQGGNIGNGNATLTYISP